MEITYEEAQSMLQKRLSEDARIKALIESPKFKETLANIVAFEKVDVSLLPVIENEVLIVLASYTTLSLLPQNIAESTGLPIDVCEGLATLIDTLLLGEIHDDLEAFEYLWNEQLRKEESLPEANKELKEKLELRPTGQPAIATGNEPKPLTREEVLQSLTFKRTMASDIESITQRSNAASLQKSTVTPTDTTSNP